MAERAAQGDSGWSSGQWLEEFAPGAVRERFASEMAAAIEDEAEVGFSAGMIQAADKFGERQEEHAKRVRAVAEQLGPNTPIKFDRFSEREIDWVARAWVTRDGLIGPIEIDWADR